MKSYSENIAIFSKILKDMKLGSSNISEYQSIYYKYLSNEDSYKTILYNAAMPRNDKFIDGFWLDLIVAAGRYSENNTLRNIIDFHKSYMVNWQRLFSILQWVILS